MENVKMLHQKQTSPQLLQFLKAKANDLGGVQVRAWSEESSDTCSSPKPVSTSIRQQAHQPKHVPDDVIDMEIQTQVFKIKRVETSGCLTYAYVTTTPTELWDLGDIFTEAVQQDSEADHVEEKACGNVKQGDMVSCLNTAEPVHESSGGPQMAAGNGITIPDFQIHRYGETEVVVSHIISPGDFYIQQVDSINKLQALITE